MPDDRPEIEIDFAGAMAPLDSPSTTKTSPANGNGIPARIDRAELTEILGQIIRPLAVEMESLRRGPLHEHNVMLAALTKAINFDKSAPHPLEPISKEITRLGPIEREMTRLGSIEKELQRLGSVETANSKLFDALHAELKTYKDNFLFDSLQRPYIRDLVSLFDDLTEVHVQAQKRIADVCAVDGEAAGECVFLRTLAGNVENQIAHMVEVFQRMDVEISRTPAGAPHDKRTHRTVAVEPAASPAHDGLVVRSTKPGFFWRERTIRPEDVVVCRWSAPCAAAAVSAPAASSANGLPPMTEPL